MEHSEEIKVRARNKDTGEVIDQEYMGQCFYWVYKEKQKDIMIERYTGFKDCNGVDIYEGDIVTGSWFKHEVDYTESSEVVMGAMHTQDDWEGESFMCWMVSYESSLMDLIGGGNCKVIGSSIKGLHHNA